MTVKEDIMNTLREITEMMNTTLSLVARKKQRLEDESTGSGFFGPGELPQEAILPSDFQRTLKHTEYLQNQILEWVQVVTQHIGKPEVDLYAIQREINEQRISFEKRILEIES